MPGLPPLFSHSDRDLEQQAAAIDDELDAALRVSRTKARRAQPRFVRPRKVKPRRVKPRKVPPSNR